MSTRARTGSSGSTGAEGDRPLPPGGEVGFGSEANRDEASPAEPDSSTVEAASRSDLIDATRLDETIDKIMAAGGPAALTGRGGFLPGLVKAVLERGLQAELSEHLGYDKGDPAGAGSGNNRNGVTAKTVRSEVGPVELAVPRDRDASFTPALVAKGQREISPRRRNLTRST